MEVIGESHPETPRSAARVSGSTTSPATCSTAARSSATSTSCRSPGSPPTRRSSTTPSRTARPTTTAIREKLQRGQIGRGAVLRARAGGPHAGRRSVPADPRAHRRRGRLGVAGGVAAAGLRHARARSRAAKDLACAGRRGRTCSSRFPARQEGLPAIEESIFAGVPINVTLLFSREQYLAAAEAYHARHRAPHRRRAQSRCRLGRLACSSAAGTRPWPARCPRRCATSSGIAIGERTYKAYRDLLGSPRWQRAYNAGARAAAAAVGQHRHQGSRRPPTSSTSRRSPRRSPSTPCRRAR